MEAVFDRTAGKGAEARAGFAAARTLTRQRHNCSLHLQFAVASGHMLTLSSNALLHTKLSFELPVELSWSTLLSLLEKHQTQIDIYCS